MSQEGYVEPEQAADGPEPEVAAPRPRSGGFDDVFGSAISRAVRRAVDGVGRDDGVDPPVADDPTPAPASEAWAERVKAATRTTPVPDAAPVEAAAASAPAEPPPAAPALPEGSTADNDPYELLGVGRRAPWEEITAAYKARARAWHPDGAPDDEQARRQELLRDLNAAYAELKVRRGR